MRKLTVEEKIQRAKDVHKDDNYEYIGFDESKNEIVYICHNKNEDGKEHGEIHQKYTSHVNNKHCYKCKNNKLRDLRKISQEQYIKQLLERNPQAKNWELLEVDYIDCETPIWITCKCGCRFSNLPQQLYKHGCPRCWYYKRGMSQKYDTLTFKRLLLERNPDAINWDLSEVDYKNNHTKVWITCNDCGWRWSATPLHLFDGTGCPNCNKSKSEKDIVIILIKKGLVEGDDFVVQKYFVDCVSLKINGCLKFDIYFPKLNLIIELDGEQHYRPIRFGGISQERAEENFVKAWINDQIKDQYCKEHNIPLLRIPYWDFKNIETILTNYINNIEQLNRGTNV